MQHESFEERKDVEWLNDQRQRMRRVKPLAGQVLIELLPADTHSAGGIELPNRTLSPEEVQERHRDPEKPMAIIGVVKALGDWPRLANGMGLLPDYGVGAKVAIRPEVGTSLQWDKTRRLKMIPQKDVLAVLT